MQKHVNLVDLVKSFPTNILLQNLASIQRRTSPIKFAHLAEKSENGSISNLSTKDATASSRKRMTARPLLVWTPSWKQKPSAWRLRSGQQCDPLKNAFTVCKRFFCDKEDLLSFKFSKIQTLDRNIEKTFENECVLIESK